LAFDVIIGGDAVVFADPARDFGVGAMAQLDSGHVEPGLVGVRGVVLGYGVSIL